MPPILTIVIPCYNQANFLSECLNSLVRQTFQDWAAVVVDDASTRGHPAKVVAEIGDPRIGVVRHSKNKGLGAARNTGFLLAKTDLVLPLDSDDYLHDDFLRLTVEALSADSSADCVFTDFQLFGQSQEIWRFTNQTPAAMAHQQWIPGAGALMRKSIWQKSGGYSEEKILRLGNEDWDFWIAVAENGFRAVHIAKPLYYYRRLSDSMSVTSLRHGDHLVRMAMYQKHRGFFETNNATRVFLADGYLNSSIAALDGGRRLRSIFLTTRGLCWSPTNSALYRQFARAIIPKFVFREIRST